MRTTDRTGAERYMTTRLQDPDVRAPYDVARAGMDRTDAEIIAELRNHPGVRKGWFPIMLIAAARLEELAAGR